MSLFFKSITIISLVATLNLTVGLSYALAVESPKDYTLLEPSVFEGQVEAGKKTNFTEYINNGFNVFLMVVIVMAIIMLTVSGLQYIISPAAGGKEEAVKRIQAAIIGLLIALSAYLILKTINPNLVDSQTLDINNIGGQVGGGGVGPPVDDGNDDGSGGGDDDNGGGGDVVGGGNGRGSRPDSDRFADGSLGMGDYGYVPSDEFEVRQQISDATGGQVTFNDSGPGCQPSNVSDCRTYVGGMNQDQINGIIALQQECNCSIVVSGAAEQGGHSGGFSHHYDGTAIDIRSTNNVNPFMESLFSNSSTRNQLGINRIIDERNNGTSPHWHIEF